MDRITNSTIIDWLAAATQAGDHQTVALALIALDDRWALQDHHRAALREAGLSRIRRAGARARIAGFEAQHAAERAA